MEYVEPIRKLEDIQEMKRVLREHSPRDLLLFVIGINTGMRVGDLLSLRVGDVRDEQGIKEFIVIEDAKDGEHQTYYVNPGVRSELADYFEQNTCEESDYLFRSKKNEAPITRQQAYRIIRDAAADAGVTGSFGTHTVRKTFGYHAYRKGVAISILAKILHHQSIAETLRYIGVDREEQSLVRVDVNL
jgi:integrase